MDSEKTKWKEIEVEVAKLRASMQIKYAEKIQRQRELEKRVGVIRALRKSGFTLQEIGDELGITRERVRQILKHESKPKQV